MKSLRTMKSTMYGTDLTYNQRGDFIIVEYNGDLTVAIAAKSFIPIKYVDIIGLSLGVFGVVGMLGSLAGMFMFAGSSWVGVSLSVTVLIALIILVIIIFGARILPGSLLQPKNRYYEVGSVYFEAPYESTNVEIEMLKLLENDDVRDDFIKLLAAVEEKDIPLDMSRSMYKNMKEVAFVDKNVSRLELESIAKQYELQAGAIREINNLS